MSARHAFTVRDVWLWWGAIALFTLVMACSDGIEITPVPTRQPDVPGTDSTAAAPASQPPTGPADTAPVSAESIVLSDEYWYTALDELERPVARWSAIATNQGAHPVSVNIEIEVFDQQGRLVGEGPLLGREEETIDSGGTAVFSIGAGPLDAEAARVEAKVSVSQIPDFRRARYGLAVFQGEVISAQFEESRREVDVTATVSVQNTGTAGASVSTRLAIYHAGALIAGGLSQGGIPNLCPGTKETLEVRFSFPIREGFVSEDAEVRVFFNYPEVPFDIQGLPTPVGGPCP
jgi:hypothetical protein